MNKLGTAPQDLKGGVAGGTLVRGILKIHDEVQIRPGNLTKNAKREVYSVPIFARIESILSEQNEMFCAIPGGLIAIGLNIDPFLSINNRLPGKVDL